MITQLHTSVFVFGALPFSFANKSTYVNTYASITYVVTPHGDATAFYNYVVILGTDESECQAVGRRRPTSGLFVVYSNMHQA